MNATALLIAALIPLSFLPETHQAPQEPGATQAAPAPAPYEADAEYRSFDFWVGD